MHPQANLNLNPDAQPSAAAPEHRSAAERSLEPASAQPERHAVSAAEKGSVQPATAAVQPAAPPAVSSATPAANVAPTTTTPQQLSASDGDKLEKPWVDRADEIIAKTAQDPYVEEEAHEELSALYLKQRFNLDIKRNPSQR